MYFFTYLVLTLINLSLKIHQTDRVMKLADLEHVLVTKSDKEMFLQMEQEVLEAFDFEVYFHHNLSKVLALGTDGQKTDRVMLLCELMFLESYEIAVNENLLKEFIALAEQPETECEAKASLKRVAKSEKYCQAIKQKYSSRLEVE